MVSRSAVEQGSSTSSSSVEHNALANVSSSGQVMVNEKSELALECKIRSNPPAVRVEWFKNQVPLVVEKGRKIMMQSGATCAKVAR